MRLLSITMVIPRLKCAVRLDDGYTSGYTTVQWHDASMVRLGGGYTKVKCCGVGFT